MSGFHCSTRTSTSWLNKDKKMTLLAGTRRDIGDILPICEECQKTSKTLIQEGYNRLALPI